PSTATALPFLNSISTYCGLLGAFSGDLVSTYISSGASAQVSSRMPPSKEMCSRLRSDDQGRFLMVGIGMPFFLAYSIRAWRLFRSQVRQGAMTLMAGLKW